MARTLFKNVKVLAIDQEYTTASEDGAAVIGSTATFELSPEDAEVLQEAEGTGKIYLTLRGISRATAPARSASTKEREEINPAPESLTIYRSGQPTRVAVEEQ
jgi:pilus assembly protein CpaB